MKKTILLFLALSTSFCFGFVAKTFITESRIEQPSLKRVTGIGGITLAVMVADCIPLLLTSQEAVAAVHVGRRGLVNGVAIKTIDLMREMGASHIRAHIGPAICGQCYEVSPEIQAEVLELHPIAVAQTSTGTPALDLPKALKTALNSAGISEIIESGICTVESSAHFSYRRDGVTGRQVGLVSL